MVSIQVRDLVETAALRLTHVAEAREVVLVTDVEPELPTVYGNRDRLLHPCRPARNKCLPLSLGADHQSR